MLQKIIEIAKNTCHEDLDWSEDTSIMSDMELSSLEFFEFVCDVEEAFGIKLSQRELNRIDTLGDLTEIVSAK